jgi:aquaporin Z
MPIGKRIGAEFLGTLVLVLCGCGAILTTITTPRGGTGHVGMALAFGLTMTAMAYSLGHISGAHLNPAVTLGLFVAKRFPGRDVMPYMAAQLSGAIAGAIALYLVVAGKAGFSTTADGFAANGFADLSPGGYSLGAVMTAEIALTFVYVAVIVSTTDRRAVTAVAPIAAGVALTAVHLIGLHVDLGSFNPARSLATALIEGGRSLRQVWLFVLAPLVGGSLAGALVPMLWRSTHQDGTEG